MYQNVTPERQRPTPQRHKHHKLPGIRAQLLRSVQRVASDDSYAFGLVQLQLQDVHGGKRRKWFTSDVHEISCVYTQYVVFFSLSLSLYSCFFLGGEGKRNLGLVISSLTQLQKDCNRVQYNTSTWNMVEAIIKQDMDEFCLPNATSCLQLTSSWAQGDSLAPRHNTWQRHKSPAKTVACSSSWDHVKWWVLTPHQIFLYFVINAAELHKITFKI